MIYIYIIVMAVTTYLIRMLPLTVFRKPIRSRFVKSFLHYVPYACLTAMTFPAILEATGNTISAWAGFVTALVIAYIDGNLFRVAIGACIMVYIVELFL